MTAEATLIKTAFENEGMSPEEIAQCQDLDIAAVKACLIQTSSKYRKETKAEPEEIDRLNFTDDELIRINEVIVETALSAEDPHLRLKAAIYVRDDKKGRKEINKAIGNSSINIFQLNDQLAKMREIKSNIVEAALGSRKQGAINV